MSGEPIWCGNCRSYHAVPRDDAHAERLGCRGAARASQPSAPASEPQRCPTCQQVLPKRWTPADHAKLLREMAKDCTDTTLQAAALKRANELDAVSCQEEIGRFEEAFLERRMELR